MVRDEKYRSSGFGKIIDKRHHLALDPLISLTNRAILFESMRLISMQWPSRILVVHSVCLSIGLNELNKEIHATMIQDGLYQFASV